MEILILAHNNQLEGKLQTNKGHLNQSKSLCVHDHSMVQFMQEESHGFSEQPMMTKPSSM